MPQFMLVVVPRTCVIRPVSSALPHSSASYCDNQTFVEVIIILLQSCLLYVLAAAWTAECAPAPQNTGEEAAAARAAALRAAVAASDPITGTQRQCTSK